MENKASTFLKRQSKKFKAPSAGMPLPADVQAKMTFVFRRDVSHVQLHLTKAVKKLGAIALTYGSNIYITPEAYQPHTMAGQFILGHELAHVFQQSSCAGNEKGVPGKLVDDLFLENEADRCGFSAALGIPLEKPVQAVKNFSGQCILQPIKTKFGDISGARLLEILDRLIKSHIEEAQQRGAVQIIYTMENITVGRTNHGFQRCISMSSGRHWLCSSSYLVGKHFWNKSNPRPLLSWLPCCLKVNNKNVFLSSSGEENDERVLFQCGVASGDGLKHDLRYDQIVEKIEAFKHSHSNLTDAKIAEAILRLMAGNSPGMMLHPDVSQFLSELTVLMFGMEPSRNAATFVTSLMILDLIRSQKTYGRAGNKVFTFKAAFHPDDKFWDDGIFYGGKFPMAVHSTGGNNMARRYALVRAQAEYQDRLRRWDRSGAPPAQGHDLQQKLQALREHNRAESVPRREISLIVHWLEAMTDPTNRLTVTEHDVFTLLNQRILQAYRDNQLPALLPFAPHRRTGEHHDPVLHTVATPLGHGITRHTIRVYTSNNTHSPTGGQHRYYHTHLDCKIIPEQLKANMSQMNVGEARVRNRVKCPHCAGFLGGH